MSEQKPTLSREEFERQVRQRAIQDSAFHEQLLADPKAALKAAFGLELPPEVEFHVVQETPSRFYLVLPVPSQELTEEDLGKVAGGVGSAVAAMPMSKVGLIHASSPIFDKW